LQEIEGKSLMAIKKSYANFTSNIVLLKKCSKTFKIIG
jgi:hypothetical protein